MILKNKTILISGGSSGIGLGIAKKCAQEGAALILVARRIKNLQIALKEIQKCSSSKSFIKSANVGNEAHVKKLAGWCKEKFGHLDGLVNCAGVIGPVGTLDSVSMDEFSETLQINLMGTVFMCHYFSPLLKNRHGKIINFSGGGGTAPFPYFSAYATGKAAVVRLTENLADEYKSLGITVNAVAPGFVWTGLHDKPLRAGKKAGEFYVKLAQEQKEKGGVPPEKAADLTAFLLSENSDGVNGKLISAPWDPWNNSEFIDKLRTQKNLATVRRIDNISFYERT